MRLNSHIYSASVFLCFFSVAKAQDKICAVRDLERSAYVLDLNRSGGLTMNRLNFRGEERFGYVPVNDHIEVDDAPLRAIGKITRTNDPNEEALCTGVLFESNAIMTSYDCIGTNRKDGNYFFPFSSKNKPSPFGGARIVRIQYDTNYEVAIGLLETPIYSQTLAWRTQSREFPTQWMDGSYWVLSGYRRSMPDQPSLQKGCSVRSASGAYLNHDCLDDFLDGTPIFAKLCGGWQFVGIKTKGQDGQVVQLWWTFNSIQAAYNNWNIGTIVTAQSCDRPTGSRVTTHFPPALERSGDAQIELRKEALGLLKQLKEK